MEKVPNVLLLGNSIFMDGIAKSLQQGSCSTITRANLTIENLGKELPSMHPDLVIYELGHNALRHIFSLVKEHNQVSHLAIDQENKQIFLYHCKCEPTGSMQELCDFVSKEVAFKQKMQQKCEPTQSQSFKMKAELS